MWHLKGTPYKVQQVALSRTSHYPHGYAYFMDMGLGKTATLLADFLRLRVAGEVDKLVVTAPFALKDDWAEKTIEWAEGNLKVAVWPDRGDDDTDVFILYYEAFSVGKALGTGFVAGLSDKHRVLFALDESPQIKNNGSVRTKSILSLARNCSFTRILSGMPYLQGPQDLWSQLKFIGELHKINYYQFRNRYCRMGGFHGKQVLGPNPETQSELIAILDRCSFRAKKEDWLSDLPPKVYYNRPVALSPSYQSVYAEMAKDLYMEYKDLEISAPMAVTLMLKLQQISSGFIRSDDGQTTRVEGTNKKLEELISIIENEVDTKIIIPVFYNESIKIVQEALEERGINYARILSKRAAPDVDIEIEKHKFNTDDSCRVALAQTSSQKYGHTLLGTPTCPCHTTIFYENTFSLDDRLQMEDRNHRIGQRFSVNVIDLNCSPIERKAINALQRKENVAKVIVDAIKTLRD